MDNTIIHTLERFENTQNASPLRIDNLTPDAGNVIMSGFELFHSAPEIVSPSIAIEPDMYAQGLAEGQRRAAELHGATIDAMEKSLAVLQDHYSQSLKDIEQAQAQALIEVFETALPTLVRQSFFKDFSEMIFALGSHTSSNAISIQCAQEDIEPLTQLFQTTSNPAQFQISSLPVEQNEMRLEWQDGGADIDYKQSAKAAMHHLISQYQATAPAPLASHSPSIDENRIPL